MPTIDHDPREPSRKVLKLTAILTVVLTLAVMIPLSLGIRWGVNFLPEALINIVFGGLVGACAGFFIGRWDAIRQFRTPGKN